MATRKAPVKEKPAASKKKAAKVEVVAAAPTKAPRETIEYGSAWLTDYVNEQAGTSYSASALRILLRKLTAQGVLDRDSEGRQRYNFPKGEKDPQVKAIVKAVKEGGAETARTERLEALKTSKKSKKAAPAKKSRAKKVVEEEEDDDDLEVDEI